MNSWTYVHRHVCASSLPGLPNEVVLEIFTHCSLKTLIAARGVSHTWQHFVDIADIHPDRRTLLQHYRRIVNAPWFILSRPWTLRNLRHFDREAYLQSLRQYDCFIPEEFALWLLEWPARAVIRCKWPGLPDTEIRRPFNPLENCEGSNCLGTFPPKVYALEYSEYVDKVDEWNNEQLFLDVPALAIQEVIFSGATWLLLDDRDQFRGKVIWTIHFSKFELDDDRLSVAFNDWPNWLVYMETQIEWLNVAYARLPPDYVAPPSPPTQVGHHYMSREIREWPKKCQL